MLLTWNQRIYGICGYSSGYGFSCPFPFVNVYCFSIRYISYQSFRGFTMLMALSVSISSLLLLSALKHGLFEYFLPIGQLFWGICIMASLFYSQRRLIISPGSVDEKEEKFKENKKQRPNSKFQIEKLRMYKICSFKNKFFC